MACLSAEDSLAAEVGGSLQLVVDEVEMEVFTSTNNTLASPSVAVRRARGSAQ